MPFTRPCVRAFSVAVVCRLLVGSIGEEVSDICLLQSKLTLESKSSTLEPRVVFSLTTTAKRVAHVKPVLDTIVEGQTRPPDVVYLSLPPEVKDLPEWLSKYNETSQRPGVLKILRMAEDYGPASKLLAAVAEGGERSRGTIIIYGDDDVLYGNSITEQHVEAQRSISKPTAFGTRQIGIGQGRRKETLLEATGTISVPASAVPDSIFKVRTMPPECRLSDDYWISHYLTNAGVALDKLPHCEYDFDLGVWPPNCGTPFHTVSAIQHVQALSETVIDHAEAGPRRHGGDWRSQLKRYEDCQDILENQDK